MLDDFKPALVFLAIDIILLLAIVSIYEYCY